MAITFQPRSFEAGRDELAAHVAALPSRFDSYFEDHLIAAQHYQIAIDGATAGFAAIHDEGLIVAFALAPEWRHHGQEVFARLRRQEQARAALVPTGDEFFLAHALDDHRRFILQAHNFALAPAPRAADPRYRLRAATEADGSLIERESGIFFAPIAGYIADDSLFVTLAGERAVGFGLAARSTLHPAVASIGMFTIESARRAGVGTATIALLIDECQRRGITPIAGCGYYNHRSKATLQRAGMYAASRLLRVEY